MAISSNEALSKKSSCCCFSLESKMLSGSYNSALIAKDTFSLDEQKRIRVLDCLTVIAGQRIMIDEILKHKDDMDIDTLCDYILTLSKRIRIYVSSRRRDIKRLCNR